MYFPAELGGHKIAAIDLDGNMKWNQDLDSNGNGVTEIGGGITQVAIATGIRRIEARSFCKWVSLEEIYLFEGLESVGDAAFARTSLQRVYLPDGLKTLGKEVFARSSLRFLAIPASVEEIDTPASPAFRTDMSEGFFVAGENQHFSSVDGALCSKDGKTVYLTPDQLLFFTALPAGE